MVRSGFTSVCYVLLLCIGFNLNYGYAQNDGSCLTPDQANGKCVDLMSCQPILKLVASLKRPFTTAVTQRLNSFKCGPSTGSVKVCCPQGTVYLDPTSQATTPENRTEPPDVTHHRNINLLPQTCGYLDVSKKIVFGENADLNEFPWMALLQYKSEKGLAYRCGGTIIHKNYILTAAHCLAELKSGSSLVGVRVGEYSIENENDCEVRRDGSKKCNPPVQDLKIEDIIPHPQFGGKQGFNVNDIGLIRVSTINLEVENARPVCLPLGIVRDRSFKNVVVTGWGVADLRTGKSSDILQRVSLPVADKTTCVNAYKDAGIPLANTQLCAGGDSEKDSCSGDSGGPMVVPALLGDDNFVYVQQGIVSYGPRYCGTRGYPGVYTQVKYYMDWILDTIKP